MAWETKRVSPLIVNPDERPSLIGSVWTRRKVTDKKDAWNSVRLVGLMDLGEIGGVEAVVTPAAEFGPSVTTTADGLIAAYTLRDEATESIERLEDLLARAASL